jgi:Protein of unknown function (DUF2628)
MALYAVHCASGAPADLANARFVKQGFRFFAFVLAPFWLLAHLLWAPFALWLAATVAIGALADAHSLTPGAGAALNFLLSLFVGFQGADWLNARVNRDGPPEAEIVAARNLAEAERTFFARATARPVVSAPNSAAPPPPAPSRSPAGGVIGLFPEAGR